MCIQALIWSAPTTRRTTSGEPVTAKSRQRRGAGWLVGVMLVSGCAWSGPSVEGLQVTQAALQAESLQAQRTIMGLHSEVQGLQRELGAARAAQARGEGELREAVRRLQEAGQVVGLQREELARARDERGKRAQTNREVQAQLAEAGQFREQARIHVLELEAAVEKYAKEVAHLKASMRKSVMHPKPSSAAMGPPMSIGAGPRNMVVPVGGPASAFPRTIIVQRGDTLWDLARKHQVALLLLQAVNDLESDLIVPGQELVLP